MHKETGGLHLCDLPWCTESVFIVRTFTVNSPVLHYIRMVELYFKFLLSLFYTFFFFYSEKVGVNYFYCSWFNKKVEEGRNKS